MQEKNNEDNSNSLYCSYLKEKSINNENRQDEFYPSDIPEESISDDIKEINLENDNKNKNFKDYEDKIENYLKESTYFL